MKRETTGPAHLLEEHLGGAHWVGRVHHNDVVVPLGRILHKLDAIAHVHLQRGGRKGGQGRPCVCVHSSRWL